MSVSHNRYQAQRWMATALEDMQAVRALSASGLYAQACFYAQQAAEKSLKAIWFAQDTDPWGHSNSRLLMDFSARDQIIGYDQPIATSPAAGSVLRAYSLPGWVARPDTGASVWR